MRERNKHVDGLLPNQKVQASAHFVCKTEALESLGGNQQKLSLFFLPHWWKLDWANVGQSFPGSTCSYESWQLWQWKACFLFLLTDKKTCHFWIITSNDATIHTFILKDWQTAEQYIISRYLSGWKTEINLDDNPQARYDNMTCSHSFTNPRCIVQLGLLLRPYIMTKV